MQLELNAAGWQVINDGVMGGLSRGELVTRGSGLLFRGQISLENNGGFSSVRCRFVQSFADITGFRLTLRGDRRAYQFRLRADESVDGVAWRAEFPTNGQMQTIELVLADFEPVIRGRRIARPGTLDPAHVHLLGFMLADRRAGPFELEVHGIETLERSVA